MTIRPFITLSQSFAAGIEGTKFPDPDGFMTRRITAMYNNLSVTDRLRIHGIIHRENYFDAPPPVYKGVTHEDMLHSIETIYTLIMERATAQTLKYLNSCPNVPAENFRRAKLFRCVPAYIAIDLADAVQDKSIAAHPSPSGPV